MSKLDELLAGVNAKRSGKGWRARCPAHDDRAPSLSIDVGADGRVLLRCHAGCSTESILAARGLAWSDLFDDRERTAQSTPERAFASLEAAIAALPNARNSTWRHVRTFPYRSVDGAPLFHVARYEDRTGAKTFRPISPTSGGWVLRDPPGALPLYGLPHLRDAALVLVVEGEGCADVGRELGLATTTSPHGAKSAGRADWSPLAGRRVALLADNDSAGRAYVTEVAAILSALNPPATVAHVELPGLGDGEDIANFVSARRAAGASDEAIRDQILALVQLAESETASGAPSPALGFEPFPADVFPAPLRDLIEYCSRADCVDPSFLALPILSNLAGAIGNGAEIELKPGWVEPSVLWTATAGRSGSRKSIAMKRAQRPLEVLQRKARKKFEHEMGEYVRKMAAYTEQSKRSKSKDTAPSARPDRPEKPVQRRYVLQDTTSEALTAILAEQEEGVVLVREELAGWVRGFDQYKAHGGSDEAFWLALYDARPIYVERKTGEIRSIAVDRPAVSLTGGVQPGILADVFSRRHQENGLLARILFAYPPDVEATWNEDAPPHGMEERYASVLDLLSNLPLEHWPYGSVQPRRLRLSAGAREAFIAFYLEHSRDGQALDDGGSAAYSKLLGACGRLALVLELAHWATQDDRGVRPERISSWAMHGAIRLSRWFAHEAMRVQALLARAPVSDKLDHLEEMIAKRGGRVSVRIWQRSRSKVTAAEARAELQRLVDDGRASWQPTTERGSEVVALVAKTAATAGNGVAVTTQLAVAAPGPALPVSVLSVSEASAADAYAVAERGAIENENAE